MARVSPPATLDRSVPPIAIDGNAKRHLPLAMGAAWFVEHDADVDRAQLAALEEIWR